MATVELTHAEVNDMVNLVAGLEPAEYPEQPRIFALIFKARYILQYPETHFSIRNRA